GGARAGTRGGAAQNPSAAPSPAGGRGPKGGWREGEAARRAGAGGAGRGGSGVGGAKMYFILVGLVQQIALKAVLGLQGYGDLSTVLSAASITYNPIVSTSIQGVSRAVAASPEAEQAQAQRRTLLIHIALALLSAASFFALAGPVGRWVGAPHVVPALRILSAVLLLYGIYTPLVGALNGKKRFLTQAGLD